MSRAEPAASNRPIAKQSWQPDPKILTILMIAALVFNRYLGDEPFAASWVR